MKQEEVVLSETHEVLGSHQKAKSELFEYIRNLLWSLLKQIQFHLYADAFDLHGFSNPTIEVKRHNMIYFMPNSFNSTKLAAQLESVKSFSSKTVLWNGII